MLLRSAMVPEVSSSIHSSANQRLDGIGRMGVSLDVFAGGVLPEDNIALDSPAIHSPFAARLDAD